MADEQELEALIADVAAAVEDSLRYFENPEATTGGRVGDWSAREVLCHFLFWHEATVKGMESVAGGGKSFRADAAVDELNARAIDSRTGQGIPKLIGEARELQARLVKAARSVGDPGATVLLRADGTRLSIRQRLQLFPHHWREHVNELRAASPSERPTRRVASGAIIVERTGYLLAP